MAHDPYGYPEAQSGVPAEDLASRSLWTSTGALLLGVIAPCTCYTTWCLALPCAVAALWYSVKLLESRQPLERHVGTAGVASGAVTAVLGLIWCSILVFYALYILVILGVVAIGAVA